MRNIFLLSVVSAVLMWSCGGAEKKSNFTARENIIVQQDDGSFMLKLDKADCYSSVDDPSANTAEWNVKITKPGRYNVWLSSATLDTLDLNYSNSVRITLADSQLEADPAIDRIVRNSDEVNYPYYRADSFMGSFYFPEPGEYNIQLISEKVISRELREKTNQLPDNTMLMSVILTPLTR
ncbi:MAG: hypothetical protein HPY62_11365 [Bacteroidales bacterium]|nr:hypothetical protein [Bacteroidales bacterium]